MINKEIDRNVHEYMRFAINTENTYLIQIRFFSLLYNRKKRGPYFTKHIPANTHAYTHTDSHTQAYIHTDTQTQHFQHGNNISTFTFNSSHCYRIGEGRWFTCFHISPVIPLLPYQRKGGGSCVSTYPLFNAFKIKISAL